MKKETKKELGKFILDLTKIIFAIVIITPFVKGESIQILPLLITGVSSAMGIYLINQGAKDE